MESRPDQIAAGHRHAQTEAQCQRQELLPAKHRGCSARSERQDLTTFPSMHQIRWLPVAEPDRPTARLGALREGRGWLSRRKCGRTGRNHAAHLWAAHRRKSQAPKREQRGRPSANAALRNRAVVFVELKSCMPDPL
jgi:hypothetical protein